MRFCVLPLAFPALGTDLVCLPFQLKFSANALYKTCLICVTLHKRYHASDVFLLQVSTYVSSVENMLQCVFFGSF